MKDTKSKTGKIQTNLNVIHKPILNPSGMINQLKKVWHSNA